MFSNRMSSSRAFYLPLAIVGILFLSWGVGAVPIRPLPAFEVHRAEGTIENSSNWNMKGKWVVIYVEGQCGPCRTLLGTLTKEKYPNLAAHTVIIVGGMSPSQLKATQSRFQHLAEARWYADPPRNALKALDLHGAPVILGIEDGVIEWGISGIPPAHDLLPRILKKWSAPPQPAPSYQPAAGNSH